MSQELYFNLDTLEGYVRVSEDRHRRYSFKLSPDRSRAQVKTEEFLTVGGEAVSCVIEEKTQAEIVDDVNRSPTFNWVARGFFGTPLLYKGNGDG